MLGGANSDVQPALTVKDVADYVCKYITKYGSGMSVSSRIASLLDDIVSRVPEGKTMTVASLLAKAFIATAVPESLCCLEAWHILWNLPRTVSSRFFKGLNMDGLTGVKKPIDVKRRPEFREQADGSPRSEQDDEPKITKATTIGLYRDRMDLDCKSAALQQALPQYNLLRFSAEIDSRGGVLYARRGRPRVMNLKPYLQLDVTKPTAAKHAKMALRMLRPWQGQHQDPMQLSDEDAVAQLEELARNLDAPRWFRKRFQHHNRTRCNGPSSSTHAATGGAQGPVPPRGTPTRGAFDAGVAAEDKLAAVRAHGLLWERDANNPAWSVCEAVQHAKAKPPLGCLKAILKALGVAGAALPRTRAGLTQQLVLHILFVDLENYDRNKRDSVKKQCLPKHVLNDAVQAWTDYHKSAFHEDARKALVSTKPYAPLWNAFKRVVLEECGLHVVTAPSQRIYFAVPCVRPAGPHTPEKEGRWRQPVTAPSAWQPAADDDEDAQDKKRVRTFVQSAANEQSMGGAGAQAEFEVPAPVDEEALECPDKGTKAEWDALWPVEHMVRSRAFAQKPGVLEVSEERLRWVKPVREGGATPAEYEQALSSHPMTHAASAGAVKLADLDPTQRAFADLVLSWAGAGTHKDEFHAMLLGTAGTGKTTTLQAMLGCWRQRRLGKVAVCAYTGVAASNVGGGARTLHDMFQLAKVNATSGDLEPLQGKDLEQLAEELDGLQLLVIDEVSMLTRSMLADIDVRLKEWRAFKNHPAKNAAFGGVGVILAGDFGQLPPIKAEHLSLLCPNTLHGHGSRTANLGMRLFSKFTTVVRLRRIHRQPGASAYKESLIRLRDGAMSKEDHELWTQHDLAADPPACRLTQDQRARFEGKVTHLFADNAGAGERNGCMAGRLAEGKRRSILRVASRDSTASASRQPCDMFGQLRRVVHILEGAPVMIIANLRTQAALVNGSMGIVVGAVLRRVAPDQDLRSAVSAADVLYVVVDVPKYCGPVIFTDHPTWVPVAPVTVRHKRYKGWERVQLPLVLAWGITIHKSQGLTFSDGCVVDFAHHPSHQPVAKPGIAFVAMSRSCSWSSQAFRNLPRFWDFRMMLKDKLFQWRSCVEKRMDSLHDQTMALVWGRPFDLEQDVRVHREWSEGKLGRALTEEELRDCREMLGVRGLRSAPQYTDEPVADGSGPRGGGGKKRSMGMKPPACHKQHLRSAKPKVSATDATDAEGQNHKKAAGVHEIHVPTTNSAKPGEGAGHALLPPPHRQTCLMEVGQWTWVMQVGGRRIVEKSRKPASPSPALISPSRVSKPSQADTGRVAWGQGRQPSRMHNHVQLGQSRRHRKLQAQGTRTA